MAGWKLRKDKASAEIPGDGSEAPAPAEEQITHEQHVPEPTETPSFFDAAPAIPSFDSDTGSDTDLKFTDFEFDDDAVKEDDGPLTLVDYSEPAGENPLANAPIHVSPILESPAPENQAIETPAWEMPQTFASDDFQERLKTGRFEAGELAAPPELGFGSGIPSVAPFVLDTPIPVAPSVPTPQFVVHIGRLAAAFPITKEVTTIGRPDSELHYYPDVEIEMDDAVSRRHAEVLKHDDGFYLVDTGSTNGTMLNGEKLPPHQEYLLVHGDRIRMGDRTEIIYE